MTEASQSKKEETSRLEKTLEVRSRQGLHARPAALFVQVAKRFKSNVTIERGDQSVDGKSIMGLLSLGAVRGSSLTIVVEGEDASDALFALEQLISRADPPTVVTVVRQRGDA